MSASRSREIAAGAALDAHELPQNMVACAANMEAKKSSSAFIREQPATMSASEIVEKGKSLGFKFDVSLVHKARNRAVPKGARAKTARVAARSGSTDANQPVETKADFVRKLPPGTPAKEVVAQAKAAGMSISETYIYGLRAAAKTSKKRASTGNRPSRPAAATPAIVQRSSPAPKGHGKAEDLLKAVAAEIGLGSAIEILQSERARVRAAIDG